MPRKLLLAITVGCVLTIRPVPSIATFHLTKIVEIFAGSSRDPNAQYVMLQMYFAAQNFVNGHSLTVYAADGTKVGTFTFGANVSNGASLATILIATSDAENIFGITADLTMDPVIMPAGGAACWAGVNCVAWGSFSAPAGFFPAPDEVFNAPDGLAADMAMHRTLTAGTGAVTPFVFAAPAPKNNAGHVGSIMEVTPTVPIGATPTPAPSACLGDCDGSGEVTIAELITLVNIALGTAGIDTCANGLPGISEVNVPVIISAVNSVFEGCGPSAEEQGCLQSGGAVSSGLCCNGTPDFPDSCSIGACGCAPSASHQVSTCACGAGMCFDRTQRACVARP